jgi:alkanesulfonate monooxygenase SsuD/methylene tetrahydromethanopterin reductase-like flavin-dependent oxidoreductase (luciferase family)
VHIKGATALHLGLFGGAQSSPADPARGYHDYLDFLLEAEALGYRGCFLTEHHFTGWGQVSAPLHMLSYLAARTTRLRLGTAVMVLAWHNPMLLAEQVATIDVLSGGRLDLGIGRGYRHNEFHGFATNPDEAEARFAESLAVMTHAWTSKQRFSHHGRFWHFDDVILEPPPLQSPHPPLWVSAGRDASIKAAAVNRHRLLLDQFTPVETIAARIETYRDAAGAQDPAMIAVARDVYIGDSAAEIDAAFDRRAIGHQRMIDAARAPGQHGGSHILAWADRPESRTEAALYGTPDQVAAKLLALQQASVTYVICNILGHHRPTLRRLIALCHDLPIQGNVA